MSDDVINLINQNEKRIYGVSPGFRFGKKRQFSVILMKH
jgi:hypothetical protein